MKTNKPKSILIHCSDIPLETKNQLQIIDRYHGEIRGFNKSSLGYYVGYHVLITDKKTVCRVDTEYGNHCNVQRNGESMNFQSLSVCVGHDGDIEFMTEWQYQLLKEQVWRWQALWDIPNEEVYFHREWDNKGKTCPGKLYTREWLDKLLYREPDPEPVIEVDLPPPYQPIDFPWYVRLLEALLKLFK